MNEKSKSEWPYQVNNPVKNYEGMKKFLDEEEKSEYLVFSGQPVACDLKTTLEYNCDKWGIPLIRAPDIEETMIREFRRVYDGEDRQDVQEDTLYCLSLLRHYGAPTRLLDFTYSKYVGVYFGLAKAYDGLEEHEQLVRFDVWCVDTEDLNQKAKNRYKDRREFRAAYKARSYIERRDDCSFNELYMQNKYELVISENPASIHKRLHLQQGVFLCPGNVNVSFMQNLFEPYKPYIGEEKIQTIRKIPFELKRSELEKAFDLFRQMNITEESLFPGLDGFARSTKYQLWFYRDLAKRLRKAKRES